MAKPAYRAYTVIKREDKDDYWLNLGVAFRHEDGEGFNLLAPGFAARRQDRAPYLQGGRGRGAEAQRQAAVQEVGPVACATNSTSRRQSGGSFFSLDCCDGARGCDLT